MNNNVSASHKGLTVYNPLFVFGLSIILFLLLLNIRPLNNPDESRYSEIAFEMLRSGDFITPRFNGVLFLDKPPLYYWLQALAIKVFGPSNGSLRFFPAAFALVGAATLYFCGRQLFNKQTATLASAILLSSPLYFFIGLYANLDMEVAIFISNALLLFATAELVPMPAKQKKHYYYGAYLCGALGFLTKGMIGIVLPAITIGLWLLLSNQWHRLKHMRLPSGLLLVFVINAPWYYLAEQANPGFLHFFFYEQQFSRFVGHQFNAHNPAYFYPMLILAGMYPWSVFSLQGLFSQLKRVWQDKAANLKLLYFICWLGAITTFFSMPASKLASYIIPALPAMAMILAYYLTHEGQTNRMINQAYVTFLVINVILIGSLTWASFAFTLPSNGAILVGLSCLCLLTASLHFLFSKARAQYSNSYFIGSLLSCVCLVCAVPHWIEHFANQKPTISSTAKLAKAIKAQPQVPLYSYKSFYYDLPIMLGQPIKVVEAWQTPNLEQNDSWLGKFAWGLKQEGKANPYLVLPATFWQAWYAKQPLLVITRKENLSDFKSYRLIQAHKRNVLISNQ